MEMVYSVTVAQQAMIILMMSLFSRSSLCLLLCMPQNAPECASEHLKLPNFQLMTLPPHAGGKSYVSQLYLGIILLPVVIHHYPSSFSIDYQYHQTTPLPTRVPGSSLPTKLQHHTCSNI